MRFHSHTAISSVMAPVSHVSITWSARSGPLVRIGILFVRQASQSIREKVEEGISRAGEAMAKFYYDHGGFPHGKPEAEQSLASEISGKYVRAIDFAANDSKTFAIQFSSELDPAIVGKYVFLEPNVVNGQIEWTSGDMGYDLELYLPDSCNKVD